MSVAASRLVQIVTPGFLGLTPQANCLSSLRDFTRLPHEDGGDSGTRFAASWLGTVTSCGWGEASKGVAASRLRPMSITVTRKRVSSLRFLARSPHLGGGDAHTRVAASRLRPTRIAVTRVRVSLLRGSGRMPHRDGCAPVCGSCDPRPAPKARQIISLGRQPQETMHPTPTSPEGATDTSSGE